VQGNLPIGIVGGGPPSAAGAGVLGWASSGAGVVGTLGAVTYGGEDTAGVVGNGGSSEPGVLGRSGSVAGVVGISATGSGVYGETPSGVGLTGYSTTGYGVSGTGGDIGVYAANLTSGTSAYFGTQALAGDFYGNVSVHGTLTKNGGSFKIDHPLDPGGKWLSHSFVESPDMKNIYDGVVTLDERGEATVEMPEWFEALNRDFRYQLTSLSGLQNVAVAKEISHNRFTIQSEKPRSRVSWQITGIRHDAYANAHRIPVVQEKPQAAQGKYLHPELFGKSISKSADQQAYLYPTPAAPLGN